MKLVTLVGLVASGKGVFTVNMEVGRGGEQSLRTKLGRMALEEWLERHGNDFDIDWDSGK